METFLSGGYIKFTRTLFNLVEVLRNEFINEACILFYLTFFPATLWLSFAVCSKADRTGPEPLNLQVSYCYLSPSFKSLSREPVTPNEKLHLSPTSVHGTLPLDVVVLLMRDGAGVGQRSKGKVVFTGCALEN